MSENPREDADLKVIRKMLEVHDIGKPAFLDLSDRQIADSIIRMKAKIEELPRFFSVENESSAFVYIRTRMALLEELGRRRVFENYEDEIYPDSLYRKLN